MNNRVFLKQILSGCRLPPILSLHNNLTDQLEPRSLRSNGDSELEGS